MPSTMPVIPLPNTASNSFTSEKLMPIALHLFITASASGCPLPFSSVPAIRSSSVSVIFPNTIISVATGLPSVMVPVLSSTTVSIRWAVSSASPDFTSIPFSAPLPVPAIIATGVASPSAHGQDITRTAIAVLSANSNP